MTTPESSTPATPDSGKQGYDPPDPTAECLCGRDDDHSNSFLKSRLAIVCPKHDGSWWFESDESEA